MNYRRQNEDFQFEEVVFSKGAQDFSKIYHEVLVLVKFLANKPTVKSMKKKTTV